jgi:hypothetical protein
VRLERHAEAVPEVDERLVHAVSFAMDAGRATRS